MLGKTYYLLMGVLYLTENEASTPTSNGTCAEPSQYLESGKNLCCIMCSPGMRLKDKCTPTSDTVCQPCPTGSYSEKMNYYPNCFKCAQCREDRGLQFLQKCTSSTPSVCACKKGMFCILRDYNHRCKECQQYTECTPGYGVSQAGTADSDVRCSPCPEGTFSDKLSYEEMCRPHTDCLSQGRAVLQPGNTASDTECGPPVRPVSTHKPSTISVTILTSTTPSVTLTSALPSVTHSASSTFTTVHIEAPRSHLPEVLNNTWIIALAASAGFVLAVVSVTCVLYKKKAAGENSLDPEHQKNCPTSALKCHLLGQHWLGSHCASGHALLGPQDRAIKEGHPYLQKTENAES